MQCIHKYRFIGSWFYKPNPLRCIEKEKAEPSHPTSLTTKKYGYKKCVCVCVCCLYYSNGVSIGGLLTCNVVLFFCNTEFDCWIVATNGVHRRCSLLTLCGVPYQEQEVGGFPSEAAQHHRPWMESLRGWHSLPHHTLPRDGKPQTQDLCFTVNIQVIHGHSIYVSF